MDKVLLALKIFGAFKDAFKEYKAKLPSYYKEDKKPKLWEFQEHLIFKRFDSFMERSNTIKEFFRTAQQFLKLEKVEIGGIHGKALCNRITFVHEEFKELYAVFSNRTYDSLDPQGKNYCIFCSTTFDYWKI